MISRNPLVGGEEDSSQSLSLEAGRAIREAAVEKKENKAPHQQKSLDNKQKSTKAKKEKAGKKAAKKSGKKAAKKGGDKKKATKKGKSGQKAAKKKAAKKGGDKKKAAKKGGDKKKATKKNKSGGKAAKKGNNGKKKAAKKSKSSQKAIAKKKGKAEKQQKEKGGKKKSAKSGRQSSSCAADSACLLAAGKYYQQVMVKGFNFQTQFARISNFAKQTGNKGAKNGDFGQTLSNLKELGGGNASALSCAGAASGTPAQSLNSAVSSLGQCAQNISAACSSPPSVNSTQANVCVYAIGNLTNGVNNCSNLNGSAACTCWKDPALATLSATVANCDISAINKNMTAFKKACTDSYIGCKTLSNNAPNLISSCNSDANSLLQKLSGATTNANALASLQNTTSKLLAGGSGKRQALSCAGFAKEVQSVGQIAQQTPGASILATTAASAVARAPSVCSAADLGALQAAANVLVQAISLVAALITSLQNNLLGECSSPGIK